MGRGERVDQPLLLADVRKEQLLRSPRLGLAVSSHSHDILDCRARGVDGFLGERGMHKEHQTGFAQFPRNR